MKTILALLTINVLLICKCDGRGVAIFAGTSTGTANYRPRSYFGPYGPTDPDNYRTSYNVHESSYGTQFGEKGLDSNTHIYNDNFKLYNDRDRKFLVEHLFESGNAFKSKYGEWTEWDDRRWRFTTKAPYFENRIPRADKILPAAAVLGEWRNLKSLLMITRINSKVPQPLLV